MRTQEIKVDVYRFDELSEVAKEYVIANSSLVEEYFWAEDCIGSLLAWAKEIGLEITDYSIDWGNLSRCTIKYNDKYVDFDYNFDLNKSLTGYCMDDTLMNPWNETKDIDECIDAFLKACNSDFEYQSTEDYASFFFEANDYEFTEDGKVFNN
jgi:hypothetical protein